MENNPPKEELLPKPQTDLPLPEKQIPAHSESSNHSISIFKNKFFWGFLILSTFAAFIIGGFYLGKSKSNSSIEVPPRGPDVYEPTPTTDPTVSWQIYNASFNSFSFRHPASLTILEDKYNGKVFRVFVQNDDFQIAITPNTNQGESTNLDITRKNLETMGAKKITPYKLSGEDALRYNMLVKGEETIGIVTIHDGNSYEILASPLNIDNSALLDQILSTFKFTNPSLSCTPRPACLESNPRCMIAETSDMCPPSPTPNK